MPPIEGNAANGQRIFDASCASCYGVNEVGLEGAGPLLVHKIYEPSHHTDAAFQRAGFFRASEVIIIGGLVTCRP
ncbi:hypothetical protein [Ruegeria arenilitoris]|uniref:hypothetical protein n=1 Tax=Ruegeria arenilitoris TaxID=1173585 RepID=UPI003F5CBEED